MARHQNCLVFCGRHITLLLIFDSWCGLLLARLRLLWTVLQLMPSNGDSSTVFMRQIAEEKEKKSGDTPVSQSLIWSVDQGRRMGIGYGGEQNDLIEWTSWLLGFRWDPLCGAKALNGGATGQCVLQRCSWWWCWEPRRSEDKEEETDRIL